jgi:hypothetical protein
MHDPERAPLVRRAFEEYATGRFTKEQLLKQVRTWGLTNRRGKLLTSQAIGMLLRNGLYAGNVDVPEYGVRSKRGDFEPLISEDLFYRVQAILAGRVPITAPRKRANPDFPLRGFVRCESCGCGSTGSWSKGRNEYYAYYHCRPGCRAVNVSKAKLEGLFADELALLQPTPGYMRLPKESVLRIWKARKAAVGEEIATAERAAKSIQDKPDRLDEAILFERSIDIDTYDRHAEKLREELTLARIDRHSSQLEELDVEGILAFAERVLPRAADLWVHASLDQRQRFQQLFFPDGIAFDGNRYVRTGISASAPQLFAGNRDQPHASSEVALGERHAGAALEIPLEDQCACFVAKHDDHIKLPGPMPCRVGAFAGIVRRQALPDVRRHPCVIAVLIAPAAKDVHEALAWDHAREQSNRRAEENRWESEGLKGGSRCNRQPRLTSSFALRATEDTILR